MYIIHCPTIKQWCDAFDTGRDCFYLYSKMATIVDKYAASYITMYNDRIDPVAIYDRDYVVERVENYDPCVKKKHVWLEHVDFVVRWEFRCRPKIRAVRPLPMETFKYKRVPVARKTNTLTRAQRISRTYKCNVRVQSADEERKLARVKRDEAQREAAKQRAKRVAKAVPKSVRIARINAQRDKRNPALSDFHTEIQSGKDIALGAALSIGALFLPKVLSIIKRGDELVKAASSSVAKVTGVFNDLASTVGRLFAGPIGKIVAVVVLWWIFSSIPIVPVVLGAVGAAWVAKFLKRFVSKDDALKVTHMFTNNEHVEIQSPSDGALFRLTSLLLVGAISHQAGRGASAIPRIVGGFLKSVSSAPRASDGLDRVLEWLTTAVNTVIKAVGHLLGRDWKGICRNKHTALKTWLTSVDLIIKQHRTNEVPVCPQELSRLINTISQGNGLLELYKFTHFESGIRRSLRELADALNPYMGAVMASNNYRAEPSCVILRGSPGCGKTALCTYFCAAVLLGSGVLPPGSSSQEVCSQMFQRGTSEYWNGYAGQAALILDDVFQQQSSVQDKDNEYINIIRMVSSWAFPLNFADLTSKGKIFFGSHLVFGTTNIQSFDSQCARVIVEPAAVARRIHHAYTLNLSPAYMVDEGQDKGRFSIAKLHARMEELKGETGLDRFPWDAWTVTPHDFLTGITQGEEIPLRKLLDMVIADLKNRGTIHVNTKKHLGEFIDGFLPQVQSGDGGDPSVEALSAELFDQFDQISRAREEKYSCLNGEQQGDGPSLEEEMTRIGLLAECSPEGKTTQDKKGKEELNEEQIASLANKPLHVIHACSSKYFDLFASCRRSDESVLKKVFKILLGLGIAFVALHLVRSIVPIFIGFFTSILAIFGLRAPEKKATIQSNVPQIVVKPQSCPDGGAGAHTSHLGRIASVKTNTFKAFIAYHDGTEARRFTLGQINYITGDIFVQPTHFTHLASDKKYAEGTVYFDSMAPARSFNMPVSRYLNAARWSLEAEHIEFVKIRGVNLAKDVTKLYFKKDSVRYATGKPVRLSIIDTTEKNGTILNSQVDMVSSTCTRLPERAASQYTIKDVLEYNAATRVGHCGAILFSEDVLAGNGRVVLGIHVAGHEGGKGFAAIVTSEMIDTAIMKLNVIRDDFMADLSARGIKVQAGEELPFKFESSFVPLGTVSPKVNLPGKTSYFKTPGVFGTYGEYKYSPALLKPTKVGDEMIYPMENAVKPYGSQLLLYDPELMREIAHVAFKPLTALTMGCMRDILSNEEAVVGIPELKLRSIPRGTSAGYPYNTQQQAGKKFIFGDGEQYDLTSSECQELFLRVDAIIAAARENRRMAHIFTDFNKDEIRSDEKVKAGKTRLISSAPIDYVVAWRRYFGAFSVAFMSNHIDHGMAPGICTYREWGKLKTHLQKKGPHVFDGDFSSFDTSEQPDCLNACLDYINQWYDDGEENKRIREVLWQDLISSRHIGGRGVDQQYIYQWVKSLPSGHPFTTIVNSMYCLMMLVGAYKAITGRVGDYWEHVSPSTYGDDNVSNVSAAMAPYYNQVTVAIALKDHFGMTYTPGNKTGEWYETTTIDKVTFLKRRFDSIDGRIVCPLELDSFLYVPYYSKSRRDYQNIVVDCCESGLEELSMHGEAAWREHAHKLIGVIKSMGRQTKMLPTQRAYLEAVLQRSDWY